MWPKLFFFEKAPKGKKNFSNYHILPQMEGLVPGARESSPTTPCHPLAFLVIPDLIVDLSPLLPASRRVFGHFPAEINLPRTNMPVFAHGPLDFGLPVNKR